MKKYGIFPIKKKRWFQVEEGKFPIWEIKRAPIVGSVYSVRQPDDTRYDANYQKIPIDTPPTAPDPISPVTRQRTRMHQPAPPPFPLFTTLTMATNISWHDSHITLSDRERHLNQRGVAV